MEFTQVLKKGSAILFLILLVHGLILGFSAASTVLAVVLAAVVCLFEAQLVKHERLEQEQRLSNIVKEFQESVKKLSVTQQEDKAEMMERLAATHSQINAMKVSQGIKRL
jgi:uncharacterized membrane protein (DUF106 family)